MRPDLVSAPVAMVRVLPNLAFPVLAGRLVEVFDEE
jgi:hypothetical protein